MYRWLPIGLQPPFAGYFGFNRHMDPRAHWHRTDHLDRLYGEFYLIVIGGGIVWTGTALKAGGRGLKAAIVEREDWTAG